MGTGFGYEVEITFHIPHDIDLVESRSERKLQIIVCRKLLKSLVASLTDTGTCRLCHFQ